MSEESDQARDMEFLCKELERHGIKPLDTEWHDVESIDPQPYAYVELRDLVRVLNAWEISGREWTEIITTVDNNLTRMTRLLEEVRTGRRTPESLPELSVSLTRPTPRPVPQTAVQTPIQVRTDRRTPVERRREGRMERMAEFTRDVWDFFKSE